METKEEIEEYGISNIQKKLNIKNGSILMDNLIDVLNLKMEQQYGALETPKENLYFCENAGSDCYLSKDEILEEISYAKKEIEMRSGIISNYEDQIDKLEKNKKSNLSSNQRTILNIVGNSDYIFSLNYSEKKGPFMNIEYISFNKKLLENEKSLKKVLYDLQNELLYFDMYNIEITVGDYTDKIPLELIDKWNSEFIKNCIKKVEEDIKYFTSKECMCQILKDINLNMMVA